MKIKLLTALLALLACTSVVQAQKNYFDYTKYTYQWWEGTVVPHDAKITETAKNPWQMNWLKGVLMNNEEIPGNWAVDDTEYVDYTVKRADGTTENHFPEREGLTVLLYALKAGTNKENTPNEPNTPEEFENSVDSIKLITNTTECNDAYILSFSGTWDRFYFAAKGKHRHHYYNPIKEDGHSLRDEEGNQIWVDETYPCGWELFSPTGNAFNLSDEDYDRTPNFIETLRRGGVYKITHDCSNVGGQGHYFSIAENGKLDPLENVTLVVPKKRYQQWDQTTHPGFRWPDTREGESGTKRDADGKYTWYNPDYCPRLGLYTANLSIKSVTHRISDGKRKYNVLLNWNSNLKNDKGLNWPGDETCELYLVNDDKTKTRLNTSTNQYSYTHEVTQTNKEQVFTYIVVCHPTGTNPNDPVQTITKTVTARIPALKEIQVDFGYRSRFIRNAGVNSYKNTITLHPEGGNTTYKIYRKPVAIKKTASFDETPVEIAKVVMRMHGTDNQWDIFSYNQISEQDVNRFDYDQNHDDGIYSGHPDDFIEVYDYFTEKTVADVTKRAQEYIYTISQSYDEVTWSTPVEIGTAPVYSGKLVANYNVYDEHQAYYDRKDMSECKPSKLHGLKIQDLETNQNKYAEVSTYHIYVGDYIGYSGLKQVTAPEEIPGDPGTFYVGRLTVNSQHGVNTYGTNEVKKLNTNITINAKRGTSAPFDKNNNINIYGALVNFNGVTDKDIAPYVYGYAVKRDIQGENPVFLCKLNNQQFADGWSSDYTSIKSDYPTGSTTKPVSFNDVFTGDEQNNGETYYDIRMYSTDISEEDHQQELEYIYVTDIRIVVEHEHSTAPIPGNYDFSYRSRFIKDAGVNSYKNSIDFTTESTVEEYKFYRKPVSLNQSLSFDETPILIADVTFNKLNNSWIYNSHNQLEGLDANRFDRIVVQTTKEDKNAAFTIADYFTEEPISDESARAAAYVYLISKSVNGVWTEPEEIGVAPVYSGKITDPVYSPSYSYIEIKMDMKKMSDDNTRLAPTDHATIEIEHYQNDYISQTERNKATYGFYRDSELAYNGLTSSSIDIKLYEDKNSTGKEFDGGVYTGQISVNSKWGLNTYGTFPRALDQIDCEISSPEPESEEDQLNHGWQWFGDPEGEEKAFFVNLFIKPKMYRPLLNIRLAHPYVYYYSVTKSVTKDGDTDKSTFSLLNDVEDTSGHGWATNIAPIKKTYPIGTSYNKTTDVNEIWIDKDYSGTDVHLQLGYYVRMYYTPTYTTGTPTKTQKFYIVDNSCSFDLQQFTTGVNDVNVDKSVVDVKYYNLMGVCSDKPFDGANIKVERHADGTTTSTKMMK